MVRGVVAATLELAQHGVVFAGDKFACRVVLEAAPAPHLQQPQQQQQQQQHAVRVAFVAVQLHGYAQLDRALVKDGAAVALQPVPPRDEPAKRLAAAFSSQNPRGDRTSLFFATPVIVVLRDLVLEPGASRSYIVETVLPPSLPASHRGKASRFGYRVVAVVGPCTSVGGDAPAPAPAPSEPLPTEPLEVLRLAFRVFPAIDESGATHPFDLRRPVCSHPSNHVVSCVEERLQLLRLRELQTSGSSLLFPAMAPGSTDRADVALDTPDLDGFLPMYTPFATLTNVAALLQSPRSAAKSVLKISTAQGLVAHLVLPRTCVRLGDVFQAVVDFSGATRTCLMFSLSLATFEEVHESVLVRSAEATQRSTLAVVAEHVEHSLHLQQTAVSLGVPVELSPSFLTSAVHVRWHLLCEFVVALAASDEHPWVVKEAHPDHFLVTLPAELRSEKFVMAVPLTVLPTLPETACPPTLARTTQVPVQ